MASIKDVAKLAGVSFSTVSIVINGKSDQRKISKATQEKVYAAMKQLNYQPNLSAKMLRVKETKKTIALFWTTDFREVMLARFLSGLHQIINQEGLNYHIVVYPYQNNQLYKTKVLEGVSNFHGAIIANASQDDLNYLTTFKPLIPIVLYNRNLENYSSVIVEDELIGKKAASLCRDYNNIAIIQAPYVFKGMEKRDFSLMEQLKDKQIITYQVDDNSIKAGYLLAKQISFNTLDLLVLPSDSLALGISHYCFENQIKIPDDIALLAIGNGISQYSEFANPALSLIEIPMEEMAKSCLKVLNQLFTDSTLIKQTIEPKIIIRKSLKHQ